MCPPIQRDAIKPILVPAICKEVATTSPTQNRRVRFHDTVDIHVIDRLDAFAVRELFYRAVDYHRFRSDCCLEKLEAQACMQDPFRIIFQYMFNSIAMESHQQKQSGVRCIPNHSMEIQATLNELAFLVWAGKSSLQLCTLALSKSLCIPFLSVFFSSMQATDGNHHLKIT